MKDKKPFCQLCSQRGECKMVRVSTKHLHAKGKKLTGNQGTAKLSVCAGCASRYKVKKPKKKGKVKK